MSARYRTDIILHENIVKHVNRWYLFIYIIMYVIARSHSFSPGMMAHQEGAAGVSEDWVAEEGTSETDQLKLQAETFLGHWTLGRYVLKK